MKELTEREYNAINAVLNDEPLGKRRDHFHNAMRKLRFGTGQDKAKGLPEHKLNCNYTLAWVKLNKKETIEMLVRYQSAVMLADKIFWEIRCGVGKEKPEVIN